MTKDEALKMAYKAEETGNLQDLVDATNALMEALEQPAQEPVYKIGEVVNHSENRVKIKQPAEPRLVSYALDGSTCTLNIDGEEVYFNREQPAQEPVAWRVLLDEAPEDTDWHYMTDECWDCFKQSAEPLYTHPHQDGTSPSGARDKEFVKLTDDEIHNIADQLFDVDDE